MTTRSPRGRRTSWIRSRDTSAAGAAADGCGGCCGTLLACRVGLLMRRRFKRCRYKGHLRVVLLCEMGRGWRRAGCPESRTWPGVEGPSPPSGTSGGHKGGADVHDHGLGLHGRGVVRLLGQLTPRRHLPLRHSSEHKLHSNDDHRLSRWEWMRRPKPCFITPTWAPQIAKLGKRPSSTRSSSQVRGAITHRLLCRNARSLPSIHCRHSIKPTSPNSHQPVHRLKMPT